MTAFELNLYVADKYIAKEDNDSLIITAVGNIEPYGYKQHSWSDCSQQNATIPAPAGVVVFYEKEFFQASNVKENI